MHRRRQPLASAFLALVTIAALAACERGDSPSSTPTATIDDTFVIITPTADTSARRTPTVDDSRIYVVEEGDTLSSIAARFGVTEEAVIDANGLTDPDDIQAGQVLVIPRSDETDDE